MKKTVLTFLFFLFYSQTVLAQQNHADKEQLSVNFHYFRIERATTLSSTNFLSRSGVYIEFIDIDRMSNYWNWYYHFGVGYNRFETTDSFTLSQPDHIPYQMSLGLMNRFGHMRSYYWLFEVSGGSEVFAKATSPTNFELNDSYSGRIKIGMGLYLMSLTAANAEIQINVSYPVTPIQFDGDNVRYNIIGEGLMRMKFDYSNGWGIMGKARFEDYENIDAQRTYFNARLMAGFFLEW